MPKIFFNPIGFVSSDFINPKDLISACENGLKNKNKSKIIIFEKFIDGLYGLEKFSHIFVIYFLDKVKKFEIKTHPGPPSIKNLPKVGVFASRSQYRPNPIALRLVKLIKIEKNVIYLEGLDAIDKTPVLDIKPYVKGFDRPDDFRTADWYDWLEKNHPDF